MNSFFVNLGTSFPIIQAPMAGSQGSEMTVAVSEAGGLGSLPCALLCLEELRRELEAIRSKTKKPYNVNFFAHARPQVDPQRESTWRSALAPYYKELGLDMSLIAGGMGRLPFSREALDVLAIFRPPVVSFHFGLPDPELIARLRSWDAKILASATTVAEALWLYERGVDAIIAQGLEAGGHRGSFLTNDMSTQIGTFALVPQMVRAVPVPVIAAGAIADAKGVGAAIRLGAAGVQVGTSYLLCTEAKTGALHRTALKSKASPHTALTNLFTGRPARGLVNRIMRDIGPMNANVPDFPLATAAILPLRTHAESLGLDDFTPLWAGQNTSGCKEISAAQLTRELAEGLEDGEHNGQAAGSPKVNVTG